MANDINFTVDKIADVTPESNTEGSAKGSAEGQVTQNPNASKLSNMSAEELAAIIQDTKGRFPSEEEATEDEVVSEETDSDEVVSEEEETGEENEEFGEFVKKMGFKNLNAVVKSYKEMQRRATKAEEERNFYQKLTEKELDQKEQPRVISNEEYLELFYEKPFEALDTYLAQRLSPMVSRVEKIEEVVELQQAIQKYPDLLDYEEEMVKILEDYPELTYRPNALEVVYKIAKSQSSEARLKNERELGRKEALKITQQKKKATGIIKGGKGDLLKDPKNMTVAELEALLPKVY